MRVDPTSGGVLLVGVDSPALVSVSVNRRRSVEVRSLEAHHRCRETLKEGGRCQKSLVWLASTSSASIAAVSALVAR